MTMYKVLYPKDYVDRLNVSRKDGGWIHSSIEDSAISIRQLEDDLKKEPEETNYSGKKQYQNQLKNKEKTRIGRKTIVLMFQGTK